MVPSQTETGKDIGQLSIATSSTMKGLNVQPRNHRHQANSTSKRHVIPTIDGLVDVQCVNKQAM
jgi:hypothetical protein